MEFNQIIIILFTILIISFLFCQHNENFTSKYVTNDNIYKGHRRDGYNLLDDSLFKNVISYSPDDDLYDNCTAKSAIDKCIQNCPGRCIEFGLGHGAYCFPSDVKS